ncbi:hypothetical protein K502DRAFT_350375 [Neoconidiobolus thromboides FSU 785]|nr:hypothetical protein K502DRAFT_350375 [Neoconidiobolus thromboides FSU 785]
MFSRLLASAVDALVPQIKSNLELLQYNWDDIHHFLINIGQNNINVHIKETNISQNLKAIIRLVKEDSRSSKNVSTGMQCLDYILQERVLGILTEYAIKDIPKGLIHEVLNLFIELFNLFPTKLLPQLTARKPMLKIIQHCLSLHENVLISEAHTSLILTIITSLHLQPMLLPLFTAKPNKKARRPSSISSFAKVSINQFVIKTENLAPIMIFFVSLQNYICSNGALGVHSRSALYELISLMSNHTDSITLLVDEPIFKELMLEQLTFQYSSMPTSFSRRKIIRPEKRRSTITQKAKIETSSIKERNIILIDTFFELWKFVNNLMNTSNHDIKEYILNGIIKPFLSGVTLPGFFHNTPSIVCSRTMYFLDMLTESSSHDVFDTLIEFICHSKEPCMALGPNDEVTNKTVLDCILSKFEDSDDEISLVSMQLFDTLLCLNNAKVYKALGLSQVEISGCKVSDPEILLKAPINFLNLSIPNNATDPILRDFLLLLNPHNSGFDDYFLDTVDHIYLSIMRSYNSTTPINGNENSPDSKDEIDLPLLWKIMLKEAGRLSQRSHERITLITGIISKLIKCDFNTIVYHLMKDTILVTEANQKEETYSELTYNTVLSQLVVLLQRAIRHIEEEISALGNEAWNAITIIDASTPNENPTPTPPSPTAASLKFKDFNGLGELKQHFGMSSNPKSPTSPTKVKFGPRVEILQFVAPIYKDRFWTYLILQEFCKEMALCLTVYCFNFANQFE